MRKSKLLVFVLLFSVILSLFAGCQSRNADAPTAPTEPSVPSQPTDPTKPSSEPTEPSVPENLELTEENIKTYIKEGMTYAQVRALFGKNDTTANGSVSPLDRPDRVWYLNNAYDPADIVFPNYPGTYLQIEFRFPGYDSYDQWFEECVDKLTIPTETLPDGKVVYDMSDTDHLAYWIENMEAVCATLCTDHKVYEVLFCQDGNHSVQTNAPPSVQKPTETPAAEATAFRIALRHAGLTEDNILSYETKSKPYDTYPNYEVKFTTADYEYVYTIHYEGYTILKIERKFIGELKNPVNTTLTRQAAIDIAMNDPLVQDSAKLSAAYERSPGLDGIRHPCYEVLLTNNKNHGHTPGYFDKDNFEYRLRISVEYNIVLDLYISYKPYMGTPTGHPEDGRLGLYTARTTIVSYMRKDGIVYNDIVATFRCNEGIDTAERSNYYEAYFEYNGEGWYYYIDMYSGELLSVEKAPLS